MTSKLVEYTSRAALGALFVWSGIGKIIAYSDVEGYIASFGLPFSHLVLVGAIIVEVVAGAALMIGYWTEVSAKVLGTFTVLAALIFHTQFSDPDQVIHFLKNIAIAGGLLHLAYHTSATSGIKKLKRRTVAFGR